MAGVDDILAQAANLMARADISNSLIASPSATGTGNGPALAVVTPSSTLSASPSPVAQPTASGTAGPSGTDTGGSTSYPLLFFVALGFGVVFTNLWIIVGVKYCFRYNARQRALRAQSGGDPITLENVPRPHRRRREKKLMTSDEVNDKFPMIKYKNWCAARARDGLPSVGGVSGPASRANSIRGINAAITQLFAGDDEKLAAAADADAESPQYSAEPDASLKAVPAGSETSPPLKDVPASPAASPDLHVVAVTSQDLPAASEPIRADTNKDVEVDADDEDEHITAALPPECVGTSGDTCAICIDTLEDDDDVRGLTCGHAFHAGCVDPWLIGRRACCPLCKADYYTPKPRLVTGSDLQGITSNALGTSESATYRTPRSRPRPRRYFTGNSPTVPRQPLMSGLRRYFTPNTRLPAHTDQPSSSPPNGMRQVWPIFRFRGGPGGTDNPVPPTVTPSQLEAGTAAPTSGVQASLRQ